MLDPYVPCRVCGELYPFPQTAALCERRHEEGKATPRDSWATRQRYEWIAEMLRIYGYINRGHLIAKFGISMPQASTDLKRFREAHPTACVYDWKHKCYRVSLQEEES